jgi:acyl carrier protein
MTTREEIETKVRAIIAKELMVDVEKCADAAHFRDNLGGDSLDALEVVMALEEEFDITIPDSEAINIETVGAAINYIVAHPPLTANWREELAKMDDDLQSLQRQVYQAQNEAALSDFLNRLKALRFIDWDHITGAGIEMSAEGWVNFTANPFQWFINASDDDARKLWGILERDQAPAA